MKTLVGGLIAAAAMIGAPCWANEAPKPIKVTAAAAAGPAFEVPDAIQANSKTYGVSTNVELGKSTDRKFTAGLFKAGPSDWPVDAYPDDEFCFFLSGSVRLTSADGSVLDVKAGEAVLIPKGWKGRWTTSGYSKYYVIYESR